MTAYDAIVPVAAMFATDLSFPNPASSLAQTRTLFLLRWQLEAAPRDLRLRIGRLIAQRLAQRPARRQNAAA